jgi:hypothetical protein
VTPRRDIVSVVDADPELAEGLTSEEMDLARRALIARSLTIEPGPWDALATWRPEPGREAVGLLVLEGLLIREVVVAGRPSSELLGGTDLLRPWDHDGDVGLMPLEVRWQALTRTHLAVLDHRFLAATCHFPGVVDRLVSRTLRRSRWLAFQLAMKQITRVEGRILVLLWALSERWGVVTPRGVHVRRRLTHEALGRLVGARRPSVTTAVGALAERGAIERLRDGYLLFGDAEQAMRRAAGEPAPER